LNDSGVNGELIELRVLCSMNERKIEDLRFISRTKTEKIAELSRRTDSLELLVRDCLRLMQVCCHILKPSELKRVETSLERILKGEEQSANEQ
jgi:hypothetical protein